MESSPAVDYQASQVDLFMAHINRDLEDHVSAKSNKFAFDFEQEKPMHSPNADFQWFEVSHFSKSEAAGKKPRIAITTTAQDRKSTAADTTLHSIQPDNMIHSGRGGPLSNSTFSVIDMSQA